MIVSHKRNRSNTENTECRPVMPLPMFPLKPRLHNDSDSVKPGHLRQRQAEGRRNSLSSASVDGAMNRVTCLRGCHDPSHWLSIDQSEASLKNSFLMHSMDGTYGTCRASQTLENKYYLDSLNSQESDCLCWVTLPQ